MNVKIGVAVVIMAVFCLFSYAEENKYDNFERKWDRKYLNDILKGQQMSHLPEAGAVPTAEVAIKIAVAVWEPIYGKDRIVRQAPYSAKEIEGYWIVRGYLPPSHYGGTALAIIEKKSGKIIHIIHGQ